MGAIIGCMTVALTLAIMEGMEETIFKKLKNVSFPAKLTEISDRSFYPVEEYLIEQKIDYIRGIEDQILIINNGTDKIIENINDIVNRGPKNVFLIIFADVLEKS